MPDINPTSRVDEHLRSLAQHRDLEEVCTRCGDCCSFAFRLVTPVGLRRYRIPDLWCCHLVHEPDGRTRCAVYRERHEKAPWCSKSIDSQLSKAVCSPRCGYMQEAQGLMASQVPSDDELAVLADGILESIRSKEHTLDPESVRRFRKRWQPSPPLR